MAKATPAVPSAWPLHCAPRPAPRRPAPRSGPRPWPPTAEQEQIRCQIDHEKLAEVALLDGCYVLETTVPAAHMDAQTVDARYRDLQKAERGFKTMKTDFLEIRPIFLRNGRRTKAHVFVAMSTLKTTR